MLSLLYFPGLTLKFEFNIVLLVRRIIPIYNHKIILEANLYFFYIVKILIFLNKLVLLV